MSESNVPADAAEEPTPVPLASEPSVEELLTEDLLVEEVSIDGMCGVY